MAIGWLLRAPTFFAPLEVFYIFLDCPSSCYAAQQKKTFNMYAHPVRTVMFQRVCGFCFRECSHFAYCGQQLAVLACSDHVDDAERSKRVWMGMNGEVWYDDIKDEPLFAQTDILTKDVSVKRKEMVIDEHGIETNKIDTVGWTIHKPFLPDGEDKTRVVCRLKDTWAVWVEQKRQLYEKWIPIQDLKMSLAEDAHAWVDELEKKLAHGMYRADLEAFAAAGSTFLRERLAPGVSLINHKEYGLGRVFEIEEEEKE